MKSHYLFQGLLTSILLIPLLQQLLKPVPVYKLQGFYEVHTAPQLKFGTWFEKDFQIDFENYMNQNFGFRNILVRVRNQIDWDFFKKANASGVLVGKEDFLFARGYLNSYKGRDFVGDSVIESTVNRLNDIAGFFKKIRTPFLIVIAPGKGWYYPEHFPESFDKLDNQVTNYEIYLRELDDKNIHFIDFNAHFLSLKDSLDHLAFPKTGIHWSNFSSALALDSILRYSKDSFDLDVPVYKITKTDQFSNRMQKGDKDLENMMNTLIRLKNNPMIYPEFVTENGDEKPKLLMISDSFFHTMEHHTKHVFNYEFWYYYDKYWEKDPINSGSLSELEDYYQTFDLVVLMCTEAGLKTFPWGFLADMEEIPPMAKQTSVRF